MSNSEPYCELKNFIFVSKDAGRNPYRKEDGYRLKNLNGIKATSNNAWS